MTEKEKMLAGMLYDPSDSELTELLIKARKLARQYNQIDEDEPEKRLAVLREFCQIIHPVTITIMERKIMVK